MMKNHCFFLKEFEGFTVVREMSAFMQYWGQLVANLGSLGVVLVLLWAVLGPNFVHIGANLGTHGTILPVFGLS